MGMGMGTTAFPARIGIWHKIYWSVKWNEMKCEMETSLNTKYWFFADSKIQSNRLNFHAHRCDCGRNWAGRGSAEKTFRPALFMYCRCQRWLLHFALNVMLFLLPLLPLYLIIWIVGWEMHRRLIVSAKS